MYTYTVQCFCTGDIKYRTFQIPVGEIILTMLTNLSDCLDDLDVGGEDDHEGEDKAQEVQVRDKRDLHIQSIISFMFVIKTNLCLFVNWVEDGGFPLIKTQPQD